MSRVVKIVSIILFICLTSDIFAQNCKYEENDLDIFTNKRICITKPLRVWKNVFMGYFIKVQGVKKDTSMFIRIKIVSPYDVILQPDSKMILTFEDNSTLELRNKTHIYPNLADIAGVAFLNYPITNMDKQKMSSTSVLYVRIEMQNGYLGKQLKYKNKDCFKNVVKCIPLD